MTGSASLHDCLWLATLDIRRALTVIFASCCLALTAFFYWISQVLHDIIENHMTEITEAGGIGCSLKQPLLTPVESQQQEQGSISSMSHYKHQSGNAQHSRIADTEAAGAVVRFDDDNNDTSSVVRNESRFASPWSNFAEALQHAPSIGLI